MRAPIGILDEEILDMTDLAVSSMNMASGEAPINDTSGISRGEIGGALS
jgi:hypothetical protein